MKTYIPRQGSSTLVNVLKISVFGIGMCSVTFMMVFALVGFVLALKDHDIDFIQLLFIELALIAFSFGNL
jgi:hypothetical protein